MTTPDDPTEASVSDGRPQVSILPSHSPDVSNPSSVIGPRSLRDPGVRAHKLARLDTATVSPLNDLVRKWRAEDPDRHIPWFDPDGAGVSAQVLVLMESPGPRTVRDGHAGFCSEDNDDPTAAALYELRDRAGLTRRSYVRWNIVPWAVYGADGAWRAPTDADLAEASPALAELLATLPEMQLIICMGSRAVTGLMRHLTLNDLAMPHRAAVPTVLGVPHPSQRNTRSRAEALARIENVLRYAAHLICGT